MIRLSHTTLELLHKCERKFQLEKLLVNGAEREDSSATVGGKAFGAGVASYMLHQDPDRALFEAWLAYWPQLEDEKRNQAKYFNALIAAFFKLDDLLQDYEVVQFEGKPAVELSFRLDINKTYYFVGYIDLLLRQRWTGKYLVMECKTTALELHDLDPLYKNSGQALGYSIVVDRITGEEQSEYGVLYFVAQLGRGYTPQIHTMVYDKTLLDRLNWFMTLGLDVKHLEEMEELGIYPRRGDSCLHFMRPCTHFGVCNLYGLDEPKKPVKDTITYQFQYDLQELITDHINRLSR